MLSFLLPFASKIISDAVNKIPDDAELGEKLIDICLVIIGKAVKLTKTDADDKLFEQVSKGNQGSLIVLFINIPRQENY